MITAQCDRVYSLPSIIFINDYALQVLAQRNQDVPIHNISIGDIQCGSARAPLRSLFLLLSLICLLNVGVVSAQTRDVAESQIKAAFLYKFCLYIEWPPTAFVDAESPLRLGVIGAPELAEELVRVVAERKINGRALQVVRLGDDAEPDKLHLLFIARAEQPRLAHWLRQTGSHPLLIVTEAPGGLDQGGMINFALQENRMRFDIGLAAAEQRGLRMSAQLLKVARTVREGAAR